MARSKYRPTPVLSACAMERGGKTTLGFSGPTPLEMFHIDPNTEEVFEKLIAAEQIDRDAVTLHPISYPASVFGSRDDVQTQAEEAWEKEFIDPLRDALETKDTRGIVLDTATELFELALMKDHGRTVQIMPEMRTKTNYLFKGLLNALKRSGKTIVLLHRLRDSYADVVRRTNHGKETSREKVAGLYEREGFNKTGFHVNIEVMLAFDPTREGQSNQYGVRFYS